MTRALSIVYKASHYHRERIFVILVVAILLIVCSYVFLLQKAIINVVQREKASQQVTSVSIEVGDLEGKYFSLKNSVTLELAHAKGLKDVEVTTYISKKPLTVMALHNDI